MKKNIKIMISTLIISSTILTSVYADSTTSTETLATATTETTAETAPDLSPKATSFSQDELSPDYESATTITLSDNNSKTSDSDNVSIEGNIITIKSSGTYEISGTLKNGQIVVDTEDKGKVQLVLNNANITSKSSAPIYVKNAKYAMITLAENSTNTLTDSTAYNLTSDEDIAEEIDATLYSKDDLVLNGTGTLNVNANYNDAIKSKDTLHILSGTYNVNSKQDAFYGKDAIIIDGGNFNVYTYEGADAVEMKQEVMGGNMPFKLSSGTNVSTDGTVTNVSVMSVPEGMTPPDFANGQMPTPPEGMTPPDFANGEMPTPPEGMTFPDSTNGQMPTNTQSTDTSDEEVVDTGSHKGFKSKGEIIINNGNFDLDVYDDGINAGTFLEINDGTFNISSGDDAVKGEYVLTVNGGTINVTHSYEGLESKVINLNGGVVNVEAFDDGINASDPDSTSETFPMNPMGSDVQIDYDNDPLIYLNGSDVTVNAGGDAIDSNGGVVVNSGNITLHGLSQGGEMAFDFDKSAIINGGNLFVLGSAGNFSSSSTQNVVSLSLDTTAKTGDTIKVTDDSGNVLFETIAKRDASNVVFSSSNVTIGKTYTVTVNGVSKTITPTQKITGSSNMGMGGKGNRGQKPTTATTTN